MESDLGDFRNSPMFTSITKKQKSATRGDSHINFASQEIFKMLGLNEKQMEDILGRLLYMIHPVNSLNFYLVDNAKFCYTSFISLVKDEAIVDMNKDYDEANDFIDGKKYIKVVNKGPSPELKEVSIISQSNEKQISPDGQ